MSVTSDIQELKGLIKDHIKKSNDDYLDVKKDLQKLGESVTRLETKADYTKEQLDEQKGEIKSLNKWKWSNIGTAILALIGWYK